MPDLTTIDPDDLKFLREQGYSDAQILAATEAPNPNNAKHEMSSLGAAGTVLKGHAGGLIGGGGGTIAGMIGGAELGALGGPAAPVTVPLGALIGGVVGGGSGSYLGQRAQQGLQSDATNLAQQEELAQAEEQHPYVTAATDIGAGALLSGGRPSISGIRGLERALIGKGIDEGAKGALIQAAVNPAITAGTSLATGQGMPSLGELGKSAIGGALFPKTWLPNGRGGIKPIDEPTPEITSTEAQPTTEVATPEREGLNLDQDLYTVSEAGGTTPIDSLIAKTKEIPHFAPGFLQGIIDRKITKVASVRRAFPNLNLSPTQAAEALRQANELNKAPELSTQPVVPVETPTVKPEETPVVPAVKTEDIIPKKEEAKAEGLTEEEKDELRKMVLNSPPSEEPKYTGKQDDFSGKTDGIHLYNLVKPIVDKNGKVLHSAGSTVSDGILTKYDIPFTRPTESIKGLPKGVDEDNIRMPVAIQAHIMNGKATTGSVLNALATTKGHPFQELAHELLNAADTKSLNVPWEHDASLDISNEWRSHYDPNDDVVRMGSGASGDARVTMEEAVHSLTAKKIPHFAGQGAEHYNRLQTYLKNGKNESVKDLINSYFKVAKHLGIEKELFTDKQPSEFEEYQEGRGLAGNPDQLVSSPINAQRSTKYAMGNLDEFLAQAMKDHNFQRVLEGIKDEDGRTVWQKIVEAVKNLLGLDAKKGTMLERVLRTGGELVNQERPDEGSPLDLKMRQKPIQQALPKDKYMGKLGSITRAVIDKIHDIGTPIAHLVADHMHMALNKEDELKGRWKNAIVQAGEHLNKMQRERVMAAFNHELATKTSGMGLLRSQAERQYNNTAHQKLSESGDYRLKIGEPVNENGHPRSLKKDPLYFPGMANQRVEQTYRDNIDMAAVKALDDKFNDYNTSVLGMSPKASQERIDNFKKALQGSTSNTDVSHQDWFNAHRKAAGTPLPPSFREQDPVRNLERYFDRAAKDAAHYEFMEKDHKVMAALGQKVDAWKKPITPHPDGSLANNQAVKAGLHQWKGEPHSPMEGNESSLSGLVSSAFIAGPALEVHKMVSNVVKSLAYTTNPVLLARTIAHGISNINEGYKHAVENGVVKLTARSAGQMLSSSATAAEKMQSLARVIRKVSTLNDLTTKVGTGLVQAMNEVIIPSKVERANGGDVTAQLFLKRLDPTYTKGKMYSPEEMQQLASRSAAFIHGTGDIRSMPAWMLNDSEFSGFFSLAHWSIAQTNNFMKDVYEPATRGDIKPLLIGVFGSAIGGYLIKELRQDIQGKKSSIPSLQEISASDRGLEGNKGLLAYNLIAAMQYSGFGGLLSQVAKYPFDFAYKNMPQGATFPLDEVASDMADTLHDVSVTIANDPNVNWVDLAEHVMSHILSTNIQLARIGLNQGINHGLVTGLPAEKKDLSDRLGQLRRFDMVEGLPYAEQEEGSNPYMNLEQKHFKMETDPQKAIQQLPALIDNIIQRYQSTPDVMMNKLQALKQNAYGTFPSLERMPLSAMKYIGYLSRMEGAEAAQAELQNYMTHKVVNQVKASAVP